MSNITWHYDADDFSEENYGLIPVGDYRAIIEKAEETSSQNSGLPMIKLTLKVNGYNSKLWGYIVLDPDNRQRTNQTLGTVFNSFAITPGNMDIDTWVGRMGAVHVRHKSDYKGTERAELGYFIYRKNQDKLPQWHGDMGSVTLSQGGNIDPDMVDFGDNVEQSGSSDIPF